MSAQRWILTDEEKKQLREKWKKCYICEISLDGYSDSEIEFDHIYDYASGYSKELSQFAPVHASIKKNVKRFHVATWFGVCSYRKLKVTVQKRKDLCPICQHDLSGIRYFGVKRIVFDRSSSSYRRDSEDLMEDGRVVWVEHIRKKYGSGSYEE